MRHQRYWLGDYDGLRDNNFTLIRIFLAWLVLYRHAFPIQPKPGVKDPLFHLFQGWTSAGELAVNGFFAISGFLVCASLLRRGLRDYTLSRLLRIYPALVVCVLLSVFVLGPLVSRFSFGDYLNRSLSYDYLTNALGFMMMKWNLPGVFEENARRTVNGSLWSITVELRCYLLLAIIGGLGLLRGRALANGVLLLIFAIGLLDFTWVPLLGMNAKWATPALMFLIGVGLYINRRAIPLDGRLALVAGAICLASFHTPWYPWLFPLPFVYGIFYLAYRTPIVATDKVIGDISYGIYIYAFPVQQTVAHLVPGLSPFGNATLSTMIVIPLAWLSWHYIEAPVLGLKRRLLGSDRPACIADNASPVER